MQTEDEMIKLCEANGIEFKELAIGCWAWRTVPENGYHFDWHRVSPTKSEAARQCAVYCGFDRE